jgi:ATP-dependent 26S proteasome regulatory subunit
MSNPELDALLEALAASPDNAALARLVAQACLDQGDADALGLVLASPRGHSLLSAQQLADAARLLAAAGDLDRARQCYDSALAANATLQDPAFEAQISGKVVSIGAGRPRVASLANDDTAADDVVRVLQPVADRVDFGDVGGLEAVKQQIRRKIITPFVKPSLFERFKRKSGGGILMYGPPGCGKTLLARATAGECGARFHNVAITDVLDMYVGESERKLHEIFELARRTAPSVVFFDEIEAIGARRQHAREATTAKLVSQFLTELDGFAQDNKGVLILGATNVPWAVDPAFRRPGRFDRVLFVPPPDAVAREAILQIELRDRPQAGKLDVADLARRTSAFSGADLRNLVETAVDEAIEESLASGKESPLTMAHLRRALEQVRPTTLEWLTSARNHARYANQGGQYDEVLEFLKTHGKS